MPGILSRHARGICASPLLPNLRIFCCGNPSMRVWSLHPRYLDPQGLVALWRETLLAHKVLQNPLNKIFSFEYLVTGKWDDPKVEKVSASAVPAGPTP